MQFEIKKSKKTVDFDLVKELIENRSNSALETLYKKYFDFLYRFVYSRTGSKESAEDIVSDTWILVIENIDKFNYKSAFSTFLIGFSMNLIRRHFSKRRDRELNENLFIEEPTEEETSGKSGRLLTKIRKFMPKLSEKYRRIIELRFIDGKNLKETSEQLNTTIGNVKVTQNRAISKLKELLIAE